jgi:hypothetical protein
VWVPRVLPVPSPTTHRVLPTSPTSPVIDASWSRFWPCKSPVTLSKQNNIDNSSSRSLVSPSMTDGLLKLPSSPSFFANHMSARGTLSPSTTSSASVPAGVMFRFPPWASPRTTPRASSSPGMLHQHSPSSPRGNQADALYGNNHTKR